MTPPPREPASSGTVLVGAPAHHVTLAGGGHFLQEDVGLQVAQVCLQAFTALRS